MAVYVDVTTWVHMCSASCDVRCRMEAISSLVTSDLQTWELPGRLCVLASFLLGGRPRDGS